jgi:transposase
MGKKSNRQYTLEFKQQAVELASRVGASRSAKQLGISVSNIQNWKRKSVESQPKSEIVKVNLEEENRLLQKKVKELEQVNLILKKAAAFFSQDHLK